MLNAGCFEITKHLGNMFVRDGLGSLQFHNQSIVYQEVSKKITNNCPVFVINRHRMLLLDCKSCLAQPVGQRVLVNFFQVSVAMIDMNVVCRLTDDIA